MDALEAIRRRRSVRRYTSDPIPREHLEAMVDAGRLAASGHNRQPWDFVVITDPGVRARANLGKDWVANAAALIAVVLDPTSRFWREDGAAAVQNMLIAATALGYGACWLEGNTLPYEDALKELLGVPDDRRLLTLVSVGVPAEQPTRDKRPLADVLHWERYGGPRG